MARRKEHTPEDLSKAQHLYEKTLTPVEDIAAILGISRSTFSKRVRAGNWQRRSADAAAEPAAPPAESLDAAASALTRAEARAALAARIQRVAEREIDAVERVLDVLGPSDQAETDRCARTLAGIARTLREITALNTPEDVTRAAGPLCDDVRLGTIARNPLKRGDSSGEYLPCMILSAYERGAVPAGFIQKEGDFEFAVRMPLEVLEARSQRLIDGDESLPFRLALR
jgi:hypothetical protein